MSWENAIVIGHVGIIGAFLYASFQVDKEHFFMKLFLFFLGLISMTGLIGQMWLIGDYQTVEPTKNMNVLTTELYISGIVFLIILFYFMFNFIIKWYKQLLENKGV